VTAQLCDVNVWLALALSGHARHSVARQWFDSVEDSKNVA
jgi:predicted nucleic acid-binding protein